MQGRHLFEYAVIRVVPRVEREEFINAGVIVYCAAQKYLNCHFQLDEGKLKALAGKIDAGEIQANLKAIEKICCGGAAAGPIGQLDLASRFRWLTATRSTMIQVSKVHPGFCADAQETLQDLYEQMVG